MPLQIGKSPVLAGHDGVGVPGWRQKEPLSSPMRGPSVRVESWTLAAEEPVFVIEIVCAEVWPGLCATLTWFGPTIKPVGGAGAGFLPAVAVAVVLPDDSASSTAAATFSSPAPCCVAGASMSVAVLI